MIKIGVHLRKLPYRKNKIGVPFFRTTQYMGIGWHCMLSNVSTYLLTYFTRDCCTGISCCSRLLLTDMKLMLSRRQGNKGHFYVGGRQRPNLGAVYVTMYVNRKVIAAKWCLLEFLWWGEGTTHKFGGGSYTQASVASLLYVRGLQRG